MNSISVEGLMEGGIKPLLQTLFHIHLEKQTIEKDRAMDRRFQTVFVYEPDTEAVYQILEKLKPIYEAYHGVKIGDDELKLIIKLFV